MAKGKETGLKQSQSIMDKQIGKLITLIENSMIVDLAMKGFSHQTIRKVIGSDIHRITKFLKPISKEIKKKRG